MSAPEKTPAVNRKLLILLGVVAALALLATFVVLPLFTTDPLEEVELVAPPAAGAPDADAELPADSDADEDADADAEDDDAEVDETFEVFTARDPFKQLVVPTVAEEAPPAAPNVDGTAPDAPAPDAPAPDGGPVPGDQPPADGEAPAGDGSGEGNAPQAPAEQQVELSIVELVDVYRDGKKDKVQVTVNGTGYDVAVNERFADHFQLLSVDGDCATFLFGDNRFVLCTGDTIRK